MERLIRIGYSVHLQMNYEIKYKGRGVIHANLTTLQAIVLFQIMKDNQMEFESIQPVENKCLNCNPSGAIIIESDCLTCGGKGWL